MFGKGGNAFTLKLGSSASCLGALSVPLLFLGSTESEFELLLELLEPELVLVLLMLFLAAAGI